MRLRLLRGTACCKSSGLYSAAKGHGPTRPGHSTASKLGHLTHKGMPGRGKPLMKRAKGGPCLGVLLGNHVLPEHVPALDHPHILLLARVVIVVHQHLVNLGWAGRGNRGAAPRWLAPDQAGRSTNSRCGCWFAGLGHLVLCN
jgi:hypothetical protein